MVAALRSLAFNALFYLWSATFFAGGFWLILVPQPWYGRVLHWHLGTVLWLQRRVLGLDFRVHGLEHLPSGPFLMAAKHQSVWETLAFPWMFPQLRVVMKRELTWLPFWGPMILRRGEIAVDRHEGADALRRLLATAGARVGDGLSILIFPQGTRVPHGRTAPYRGGVARLYLALGVPLVPVALDSGRFWAKGQWIKRPGVITVRILPVIAPGGRPKSVLRQLEQAIEAATDALYAEAAAAQAGSSSAGKPGARRSVPVTSSNSLTTMDDQASPP